MYEVNEQSGNHRSIVKKFKDMGARVKFREPSPPMSRRGMHRRLRFRLGVVNTPTPRFTVDIRRDKRGEYFDILASKEVSLNVVNIDVEDRHLLINAAIPRENPHEKPDMIKALCGHDERHWFSSQVNSNANNVKLAKEFLKPDEIIELQKRAGVKNKNWNKRKNKGFIRQGEWFFVPTTKRPPSDDLIHEREPLIMAGRRGGGKPHIARYAFRKGGETVYVQNGTRDQIKLPLEEFSKVRRGVTNDERKELFKKFPFTKEWNWRPMTRNPEMFVKGTIRHPDHATITLKGWHRVIVNGEIRGANVVFLD